MKKKPAFPLGPAELRRNQIPLLRYALISAAYICAFILFDFITKQFEELPGIVTWYPPAGLTYTLLLAFGVSFAPAVTVALLISSVFIYRMPQPPYLLFLWACIISLIYAAAAAFLRRRIRFDWRLRKLRDVAWLVATTVLVSALLAVLSVSSSALSSNMPRGEILRAIFDWWIGETVGVLTVTPFLLVFVVPGLKRFAEGQPVGFPVPRSIPRPKLSVIGQAASIAFVLYWVFGARVLDEFHPLYLLILPLIWIALQRGFKGVSAGILALNFGMVLALWLFRFDLARLGELELLMIVNCVVGLLLGAVVTERRQAEAGLREGEEKYRTLVDEVNDGFFVTDSEGVFTFANPALARIYGMESPQALVGRKFSDFQAAKEHGNLGEAFRSAMQTGRSPEVITGQILRPDGKTAFIEFKPAMIVKEGRWVGSQGVVRDVTERKEAENALRESEAEYRDLFENSVVGISQALPNGRLLRTNSAYAQMYGYTNPEEIVAEVADVGQLYLHPEDRDDVLRILKERGVMEPREMAVVRRDGTRFIVLVGAREIKDSEGGLRCYQAEHIDITARKQAEEELRQSEARFRILFERAADVILQLEITAEGIPVIREANNATLRVLGYTRDELIGRPVSFIEDVSDAAMVVEGRRKNILSGTGTVFETRHRCKDGTTRDFECSVTEMKIGTKTFAISFERDITERTRSVDRIRRQFEHLTAMSAIDRVIAANYDLLLSLSEILAHVTTELGMDAADILILNSNSQKLEFCAEHGFRTNPVKKVQIRLGESYAGRAALERHLVQVSNLAVEPNNAMFTTHWKSEEFVCYYGVPLISKGQVKGVLEVFHRTALEPDKEWFDFLNALAGQTAIAIENSTLFESLQRSNMDLSLAYDATIEGWSRALDLRDKETEGHTQRVTEATVKLARTFGMSDADLVQVRWGALLHDIGKMGVPDGILHKPGPLSDEEWVAMKKHPTFAYEMLSPIGYLRLALDIPYCHHEKWDGSGYPRGLKGDQIPLIARIFAVVDVWDALRSDRPYRAAWKEEKVREYILSSSGTHFDPKVVDVFMQFRN